MVQKLMRNTKEFFQMVQKVYRKKEKETKKYNFRQTLLQPKLDFLVCLCFFEPFPYPIVITLHYITNRNIFA